MAAGAQLCIPILSLYFLSSMKDVSSRRPQLGSKQFTCWLGLALLLVPASLRATDPSFVNSGVINFPVQIDAFNFVNSGDFFVNSALPFELSLIHISEPTRLLSISYAVFCLKKKK